MIDSTTSGRAPRARVRADFLCVVLLGLCTTLRAAPPVGVGVAWAPIPELSDEFNTQHPNPRGDGIDDAKWWDDHPQWNGRLPSQFSAANSWVDEGMLNLRGTSRVTSLDQVANPDSDHWIDTAAVVSKTRATHGSYYEARVRVADISLDTAFWFRMNQFSEIDVFEIMGDPVRPNQRFDRDRMSFTTILYGADPDIVVRGNAQMVDDAGDPLYAAENFITYGVWWKGPEEIRFYYNDQEVGNFDPGGPFDEGLHMIFDLEAFFWMGLPTVADLNDPAKNTAQVDWVRSYRAVELLAGDYDANGVVDTQDYRWWRSDYGMTGPGLAADGNGDGVVDGIDYALWRENFGASAAAAATSSVAATPEPAACVLLLAGGAAIVARTRLTLSRSPLRPL